MHTIKLNRRQARMLRDNLTSNQGGYDYTDLCRLDHLARKLTALQGEYAEHMAELARDEKRIRRQGAAAGSQLEIDSLSRELLLLSYEVEDLNEAAEAIDVEFRLEDGDYRLISDKLDAVSRWQGSDDIRHVIIGMVEAVRAAETGEAELDAPMVEELVSDNRQGKGEVKPLRRR